MPRQPLDMLAVTGLARAAGTMSSAPALPAAGVAHSDLRRRDLPNLHGSRRLLPVRPHKWAAPEATGPVLVAATRFSGAALPAASAGRSGRRRPRRPLRQPRQQLQAALVQAQATGLAHSVATMSSAVGLLAASVARSDRVSLQPLQPGQLEQQAIGLARPATTLCLAAARHAANVAGRGLLAAQRPLRRPLHQVEASLATGSVQGAAT